MDASQYLKQKTAAMTHYTRRTIFKDAGFRTETIGKAVAVGGQCGTALLDPTLYTTPYITTPCCPITYAQSTVQLSVNATGSCNTYQATPAQMKTAVAGIINKGRECCSAPHTNDEMPC